MRRASRPLPGAPGAAARPRAARARPASVPPGRPLHRAALAVVALGAAAATAWAAARIPDEEIRRLDAQARDPQTSVAAAARIAAHLAEEHDTAQDGDLRYLEAIAHTTTGRGWDGINYSVVRMIHAMTRDSLLQAQRLVEIGHRMVERDRMQKIPRQYADRALRIAPKRPESEPVRHDAMFLIARFHLKQGEPDSTLARLAEALPGLPAGQHKVAQFVLGRALAVKGNADGAIEAFARSLVAEPAADTSVAPVLRAAWLARHGSLDGLDQRIAEARAGR